MKKNLLKNTVDENPSNGSGKSRKKYSRSNIICLTNDEAKRKAELPPVHITTRGVENSSNAIICLKSKIKELNTELNKLRNDSNVKNYNILQMNYKLKDKEIIELRQKNNYYRFQLQEKSRNNKNSKIRNSSLSPKTFYINKKTEISDMNSNSNKNIENDTDCVRAKTEIGVSNNLLENENSDDKNDLIQHLKFDNNRLRKLGNENYSLRCKIEEFQNEKEKLKNQKSKS